MNALSILDGSEGALAWAQEPKNRMDVMGSARWKKLLVAVVLASFTLMVWVPCAFAAQENPLDHAALAAKKAQGNGALETLEIPEGARGSCPTATSPKI